MEKNLQVARVSSNNQQNSITIVVRERDTYHKKIMRKFIMAISISFDTQPRWFHFITFFFSISDVRKKKVEIYKVEKQQRYNKSENLDIKTLINWIVVSHALICGQNCLRK